jgi:hypothetical protein
MFKKNRRSNLIQRMDELESKGLGCQGCSGNCCTFEANSMMITPLETFELITYLHNAELLNDDLKKKLQDTVIKYRLNNLSGNGKKSFIRRTYTCPFFAEKELGCPLPREIKPYGCLAFNSHHASLKASEHCFSEQELLSDREENNQEDQLINQRLKEKLNLFWDKEPIPVALLELWEKFKDFK